MYKQGQSNHIEIVLSTKKKKVKKKDVQIDGEHMIPKK